MMDANRVAGRSVLRFVVGASVALTLIGCDMPHAGPGGAPSPAPAATHSVAGIPPAAGPTSAAGTKPTLCEAPRPAQQSPFPFNKDAARRDSMIGAGRDTDRAGYAGGIAYFDDLDAAGLAWLLNEKFIDPHDYQNAAPSVWEIFRFLCAHPNVRAAGYVVSLEREDYRTSIETIYASEIDADLRTDARTFCVDAETTFEGHLECFWD